MAQLLPAYPSTSSSFRTGLGKGLELLAQQKLKDYQHQQKVKSGMPILQSQGYTSEEAQAILNLPEGLQKVLLEGKQKQEKGTALFDQMRELLGAPTQGGGGEIGAPATPAGEQALPAEGGLPAQELPATEPTQPAEKDGYTPSEKRRLLGSTLDGKRGDVIKAANDIEDARTKQKQREEDIAFRNKKETRERRKEASKRTAVSRKEILDDGNRATEDIRSLDRMSELNKKGDLNSPHYIKALEKFNIKYSALLTPDTQEFEKLSAQFIRNARAMFGARVTNFELDAFLKTIPTLMQTQEGMQRVIDLMKVSRQGAQLRSKEMRDKIKEDKGISDFFEEELQDRMDSIATKSNIDDFEILKPFKLPDAASYPKGSALKDDKTGKVKYIHDGSAWKEA